MEMTKQEALLKIEELKKYIEELDGRIVIQERGDTGIGVEVLRGDYKGNPFPWDVVKLVGKGNGQENVVYVGVSKDKVLQALRMLR